MKILRSMLVAIALGLAMTAHSDEPGISALEGKWAVDVSLLPIPAEARPKSVTITFAEAEGGRLATRVEVVSSSDTTIYAESVAELNGRNTKRPQHAPVIPECTRTRRAQFTHKYSSTSALMRPDRTAAFNAAWSRSFWSA